MVVLAVYASQSLFAMGQAQAALTELAKKHGEGMPCADDRAAGKKHNSECL